MAGLLHGGEAGFVGLELVAEEAFLQVEIVELLAIGEIDLGLDEGAADVGSFSWDR